VIDRNLDATVASTKYSVCKHWEQGPCSWVGSLRFSCDLREFKHVASTVSTEPPVVLVDRRWATHAVCIERLGELPRSRGLSTSTPDAKCLILDILANPRLF
jgi:hypothetical protein